MSDTFSDTHGSRIASLLVLKNYVNNYLAIYRRLAHSRIRADLPSPADLGLETV